MKMQMYPKRDRTKGKGPVDVHLDGLTILSSQLNLIGLMLKWQMMNIDGTSGVFIDARCKRSKRCYKMGGNF